VIDGRVICIRLICIIFTLALSVSAALGDVRISHSYSTEGGEVNDDVYLHNVDYANSVSIYQDSLFAAADSVLGDEDEKALFSNQIITRGEGRLFGTSLKAGAEEKFNHQMSLATGSYVQDKTSVSYNLESGIASADYFTDGGSVSEDVIVKNVNYANRANIYPQSLSCSADADLVDGIGLLMDRILVDSEDGLFGTALVMVAKEQLSLDKEFEVGRLADAKSDVSYAFEFGETNANYFNSLAEVNEFILTDSCMYQGSIKNSAEELQSKGHGKVTEDDPGMFIHNIEMNYGGLPCEIVASLSTGDESYGSKPGAPVRYIWDAHVESDEDHAKSTVSAKGYNGNRDVDFEIKGRSEGLTDKIAGPMHISPIGFIGISKELYMSYEITR
jgi:hypothetical protein